jgi:hypothetical protein
MAEHEATCQHRTEPCGMCGQQTEVAELAQHQLVCPKRQVDCDNHGCGARVAFDELAAHKGSDCGYEEVGCPFADMGCTARILRKDIDSHERDDSWKHNRLLLGKAKEQQLINQQSREEQQKELEVLKEAHDELNEAHGRLKQLVGIDELTLRVKHAVLTGAEPFVPLRPEFPTWIYSEDKVVQGHKLCIYVDVEDENAEDQEPDYCVFLQRTNGPVPCKLTWTFKLVHYDGNPESAIADEGENAFDETHRLCCLDTIPKARLASPGNNPYVKDGYVTFKCAFKIVNE